MIEDAKEKRIAINKQREVMDRIISTIKINKATREAKMNAQEEERERLRVVAHVIIVLTNLVNEVSTLEEHYRKHGHPELNKIGYEATKALLRDLSYSIRMTSKTMEE